MFLLGALVFFRGCAFSADLLITRCRKAVFQKSLWCELETLRASWYVLPAFFDETCMHRLSLADSTQLFLYFELSLTILEPISLLDCFVCQCQDDTKAQRSVISDRHNIFTKYSSNIVIRFNRTFLRTKYSHYAL